MEYRWISEWIMELAAEALAYVRVYETELMNQGELPVYQQNRMDKWMQYRILREIGEEMGADYKSVAFLREFGVVEPEKLLYNEKENCYQYQALYEAVEEPWRPMVQRVQLYQQGIVMRLISGG